MQAATSHVQRGEVTVDVAMDVTAEAEIGKTQKEK